MIFVVVVVVVFNAVKCNLTKFTTKSKWYFRSAVSARLCTLSVLRHCTSVFERGGGGGVTSFQYRPFPDFSPPPRPKPSPSPSPLLTQCDRCLNVCMGAHGWLRGLPGSASHGSVILSRGRLVTVETPGYPIVPSSIQLDTVVNKLSSYNSLT